MKRSVRRAHTAISVTGVLSWAVKPQSRRGCKLETLNETSVNANLMRTTSLFQCSWYVLLPVFCKSTYFFGGFTKKCRVSSPVCFAKCLSVCPSVRRNHREAARTIFITVDTGEFSECCQHIYMLVEMDSNAEQHTLRPVYDCVCSTTSHSDKYLATYGCDDA